MTEVPNSFEQLKSLDRKALKRVYASGTCPNLDDLKGAAKGVVLDPKWFDYIRLWRGKHFSRSGAGEVKGKNILGIGLFSYQKYQFDVSIERSLFSDRNIAYINHDYPVNPAWVRRFHDEMVELHPGFYLACSHYSLNNSLRYMSYFAFDFR